MIMCFHSQIRHSKPFVEFLVLKYLKRRTIITKTFDEIQVQSIMIQLRYRNIVASQSVVFPLEILTGYNTVHLKTPPKV